MSQESKIEFFDSNMMIGRFASPKVHLFTVPHLEKEMKFYEIKKGMVFHSFSWWYNPQEGNKRLIQELKGKKNLLPVWVLLPFSTGEFQEKKLKKELIKNRIVGIRLFPKDHYYHLSLWNTQTLFSLLNEFHLPTFIDLDQLDFNELEVVLKSYKKIPLIITKTRYTSNRILYSFLERYENFYIETSNRSYRGIEDIVQKFGAERLIFGTNFPFFDPGQGLMRVIYAEIEKKEKKVIASMNLERILGGINYEY